MSKCLYESLKITANYNFVYVKHNTGYIAQHGYLHKIACKLQSTNNHLRLGCLNNNSYIF